jgi:hypothetical protein
MRRDFLVAPNPGADRQACRPNRALPGTPNCGYIFTGRLAMPAAHLLQIAGYEFRFAARAPMRMPGYLGSAWRGGFGRALRRAVCITGLPTCPGCAFEARQP